MSYEEKGIYTDLLAHCWLDNGLPSDLRQLAALLKIPAKRFDKLWAGVLHECFIERNGRMYNQRLDIERKKQAEFRKSKQDAAHMRWSSTRSPSSNAHAMPSVSISLSDSISVSHKRERGATIIQPRRQYAAWEGPKGLYVPQKKHADFVALRNHPTAESELLRWYAEVAEAWQGSPGGDMLVFWTARFTEKWPPPSPARRPRGGLPAVDWTACDAHTPPCASAEECRQRNLSALAAKLAAKEQATT